MIDKYQSTREVNESLLVVPPPPKKNPVQTSPSYMPFIIHFKYLHKLN